MAARGDTLRTLLRSGRRTSADMQRALGVSQPVMSRLIDGLGAEVIRMGRGRNTSYALRREIPGIGSAWPVVEIDELGEARRIGTLHALHAEQYWFAAQAVDRSLLSDGLPFFLQDLRPQGFIGRGVPQRHPELGLPERISEWDDSDALRYLVRHGEDSIGNILIGDESLSRYWAMTRAPPERIRLRDRDAAFERLAVATIAGAQPGSSAGGEHPKFTCIVDDAGSPRHVLVKFSPDGSDPVSRRWSDLLIAEHLSISALTRRGLSSARTAVFRNSRRAFLVSGRFDRTGPQGRIGVISLAALDDELIGSRRDWIHSAGVLLSMNRISREHYDDIRRLAAFGRHIGNTDMHSGNISFLRAATGELRLAPIYDMLPMRYAPTAANPLPDEVMAPPVPTAEMLDVWGDLARHAADCWTSISEHPEVSSAFTKIAKGNAKAIRRSV